MKGMRNTHDNPRRKINLGETFGRNPALVQSAGLGAHHDPNSAGVGAADIAAPFIDGLSCDISKIPVFYECRSTFGALPDATVQTTFGANPQLFNLNPSQVPSGFTSIETTPGLLNGELQTYALIAGVYCWFEPEPWVWTLPGNAWTAPLTGTAMPVSPDVFTANGIPGSNAVANQCSDIGAVNALGIGAADTFLPALLNYGEWIDEAFWHIAKAYNWFWSWGNRTTLMDQSLRTIAYMPELGSGAGIMPTETIEYVRQVNAQYRSSSQPTSLVFLPQNAKRMGSITSGTGQISRFSPDRSFDRVQAIAGGTRLSGLLCSNDRVYRLDSPYIVRPGVNLGMQWAAADSNEQQLAQQFLSISQGLGLNGVGANVPPSLTPDGNVNAGPSAAGVTASTFVEQTTDNPPVLTQVRTLAQRVLYKGGLGSIRIGFVGNEITEQQKDQLLASQGAQDILYQYSGLRMMM